MKKQNILFDLDDTLIHCNKYFNTTIDEFVAKMSIWFSKHPVTVFDLKEKQLELDLAGVHIHGFMKDRFPQSLVETYDYFTKQTGRESSLDERDMLFELGRTVYNQDYEAYPHMEQTLIHLIEEGHELSLYTGGDIVIQSVKIKQMELERFFDKRIYISQHKTRDTLEHIIVEHKLVREETWMVGNSARTDVLPALETGIHSIYIPNDNEWRYNIIDINVKPVGAFITLESIKEVPAAIKSYKLKSNGLLGS